MHLLDQIFVGLGILYVVSLAIVVALCKASASADEAAGKDCAACGRRAMPGWQICLVCRNRIAEPSVGLESLRDAS